MAEFDGDCYCKDCGSLLLRTYAVPIQGGQAAPVEALRKGGLEQAAENLRLKSEGAREYEVVTEPAQARPSGSVGGEGWIYGCEFDDALRLKADLERKFDGKTLPEASLTVPFSPARSFWAHAIDKRHTRIAACATSRLWSSR